MNTIKEVYDRILFKGENLKRIEINPKVFFGKQIIKGTRIPFYVVLNLVKIS